MAGVRRLGLTGVAVLAVGLVVGLCVWWWHPGSAGDSRQVTVYELNEKISGATKTPPNLLRRLLGECDGDSYYVRDGDRHYCLVLNGPLPVGSQGPSSGVEVTIREQQGLLVIPADSVAVLRGLADDLGSPPSAAGAHVVLVADGPVAVVPVTALDAGGELRMKPFVALCTRNTSEVVWPDDPPPEPAGGRDCDT